MFAEAAEGARPRSGWTAMGHAYEDRLLPDRHALMFQMQSHGDRRSARSTRTCARGSTGCGGPSPSWPVCPRRRPGGFFADGMLLNVVAMLELDWTAPGASSDLPPPPGDPARLAGAGAGRRGVRAAGVRGAGQRQRLRRSVGGGGRGAQRDHGRRPGRSRRRRWSCWCGWAATSTRVQARGADPRSSASALRYRGVARVGRVRAGRRSRGWSRATGARRTCWRRSSRTRRERGRSSSSGWRATRGWSSAAGAWRPTRSATRCLGGHRARRADRVPDPVPAVAARVPVRGLGAAAAGGGRGDDPAVVPGDPVGPQPRSTRCRSTP